MAISNRCWVACAALFLWVTACDKTPDDLREWTAKDHDHTSEPGSGQVDVEPDGGGAMPLPGVEHQVLIAWRDNCVRCHGQIGRGDGPQGRALNATNLADPVWQQRTSDEQIRQSIHEGKGMMPKSTLPDATIDGLVKLIRLMVPKDEATAEAGAGGTAAAGAGGTAAAAAGGTAAPPGGASGAARGGAAGSTAR